MARPKNNILISALVIIAAMSASCSGNSAMNMDMAQNTENSGDAAAPIQEDGAAAAMPGLPKSSSDWFEIFPDLEFDIDWEAIIEAMHIPLALGDNEITVTENMYASADVGTVPVIVGFEEVFPGIEVPVLGDALHLQSSPGAMSYATYGFRDIPADKDIIHISAEGSGTYLDHEGAGLYIGISDYSKGAYRWYGPFGPDSSEWDLPLHNLDNTNDTQHAYVTFAVYNGDEAILSKLHVEVGTMQWYPHFDWDDLPLDFFLGEDGFTHFPTIPDPPPGL